MFLRLLILRCVLCVFSCLLMWYVFMCSLVMCLFRRMLLMLSFSVLVRCVS